MEWEVKSYLGNVKIEKVLFIMGLNFSYFLFHISSSFEVIIQTYEANVWIV